MLAKESKWNTIEEKLKKKEKLVLRLMIMRLLTKEQNGNNMN